MSWNKIRETRSAVVYEDEQGRTRRIARDGSGFAESGAESADSPNRFAFGAEPGGDGE